MLDETFFQNLKSNFMAQLPEDLLNIFHDMLSDLKTLVINAEKDIVELHAKYAEGELTKEYLEYLIGFKAGTIEAELIKNRGLAKSQAEKVRLAAIRAIAKTIVDRI